MVNSVFSCVYYIHIACLSMWMRLWEDENFVVYSKEQIAIHLIQILRRTTICIEKGDELI